jgi:hypothetical protein
VKLNIPGQDFKVPVSSPETMKQICNNNTNEPDEVPRLDLFQQMADLVDEFKDKHQTFIEQILETKKSTGNTGMHLLSFHYRKKDTSSFTKFCHD